MPSFCNFQKTAHRYISLHVAFDEFDESDGFHSVVFLFIDRCRVVDQCALELKPLWIVSFRRLFWGPWEQIKTGTTVLTVCGLTLSNQTSVISPNPCNHPTDHDYHIQCIGSNWECFLCDFQPSNGYSDSSFEHKIHLKFPYNMIILHFFHFQQDMPKTTLKAT